MSVTNQDIFIPKLFWTILNPKIRAGRAPSTVKGTSVMKNEQHYTQVEEIVDDPRRVNSLIDGGGWDLLEVAKRKLQTGDGAYEIVYVIGHRADAQQAQFFIACEYTKAT